MVRQGQYRLMKDLEVQLATMEEIDVGARGRIVRPIRDQELQDKLEILLQAFLDRR